MLTNRKKYCNIMLVADEQHEARRQCGSIAQLGEHLPYKQGVTGSSPVVPTSSAAAMAVFFCFDVLFADLSADFVLW